MAHFRATMVGQSGKMESRLGSKSSGLEVRADAWNVGVRVDAWHAESANADTLDVVATGGSNGRDGPRSIATIQRNADGSGDVVVLPNSRILSDVADASTLADILANVRNPQMIADALGIIGIRAEVADELAKSK